MKKHAEGLGGAVGNNEAGSGIRFAHQRKKAGEGVALAAENSIAGMLPYGVPPAVRQQVRIAVEACVMRILSEMASVKVFAGLRTDGVNRIVTSGDELMLRTASGVVIYLKRNRMTRLLLMLLCNPGKTVPRALLGRAEDAGPWRLLDAGGNAGDDAEVAEDGTEVAPEDDCHLDGESCGPVIDEAALDAYCKRLKAIGVLRKEAVEDDDHREIAKLDEEVKIIERNIIEATPKPVRNNPTKIRLARPPKVKKDLHRLHAAFERVIAVIGEKDPVLGEHLDCGIVRNGAFRYDATPDVPWDIASDVLAATRAKPKELAPALDS